MRDKTLSAITALSLLAGTVATAQAQLRMHFRVTPQVRVLPSPTPHFNPKEITIDKPVNWQKSHSPKSLAHPIRDYAGTASSAEGTQGSMVSGGGTRQKNSEGGVTGFTRKVIGVRK